MHVIKNLLNIYILGNLSSVKSLNQTQNFNNLTFFLFQTQRYANFSESFIWTSSVENNIKILQKKLKISLYKYIFFEVSFFKICQKIKSVKKKIFFFPW